MNSGRQFQRVPEGALKGPQERLFIFFKRHGQQDYPLFLAADRDESVMRTHKALFQLVEILFRNKPGSPRHVSQVMQAVKVYLCRFQELQPGNQGLMFRNGIFCLFFSLQGFQCLLFYVRKLLLQAKDGLVRLGYLSDAGRRTCWPQISEQPVCPGKQAVVVFKERCINMGHITQVTKVCLFHPDQMKKAEVSQDSHDCRDLIFRGLDSQPRKLDRSKHERPRKIAWVTFLLSYQGKVPVPLLRAR